MLTRLRLFLSGELVRGTAVLFLSMTIVNGGNYLFNLVLGRWLGPAAFADLSLLVTLMLMITFITATFQLTAAKFAAVYNANGASRQLVALHSWLRRLGWLWGTVAGLVLVVGAWFWQEFFHTQSPWPFVILGVGLPVYFVQGVERGLLQGESRFGRLALSYQAEMWVRLLIGMGLVALGWAVNGAVLAITFSFFATWLLVRRPRVDDTQILTSTQQKGIALYAGPVIVVHLGQILINNSDILVVKRFFAAAEAGQYAALALIGRIVFFATWSVVTVLFPLVAQKQEKGEPHRYLLGIGLGMIMVVSSVILLSTWLFPQQIIRILFGEAYLSVAPLLWQYALATTLYALANLVVTYHLSLGSSLGSYLTALVGLLQIGTLIIFHDGLEQVIWAQIWLMTILLGGLIFWDRWQISHWKIRFLSARLSQSIGA